MIVVSPMSPSGNNLPVTFNLSPGGSGNYFPRRMASGSQPARTTTCTKMPHAASFSAMERAGPSPRGHYPLRTGRRCLLQGQRADLRRDSGSAGCRVQPVLRHHSGHRHFLTRVRGHRRLGHHAYADPGGCQASGQHRRVDQRQFAWSLPEHLMPRIRRYAGSKTQAEARRARFPSGSCTQCRDQNTYIEEMVQARARLPAGHAPGAASQALSPTSPGLWRERTRADTFIRTCVAPPKRWSPMPARQRRVQVACVLRYPYWNRLLSDGATPNEQPRRRRPVPWVATHNESHGPQFIHVLEA